MSERPPLRKGMAVLALLAVAGIGYLVTTQIWITAVPPDTGTGSTDAVPVTGTQANAVLGALALVSAAATLFLALAGRVGRWVSFVVLLLAALAYGAATIVVMANPGQASRSALSEGTGLDMVAQSAALTSWPMMAVGVAAVQAVLVVVAMLSSGRWNISHKYERASVTTEARQAGADGDSLDSADSWDAQTRGEDPS